MGEFIAKLIGIAAVSFGISYFLGKNSYSKGWNDCKEKRHEQDVWDAESRIYAVTHTWVTMHWEYIMADKAIPQHIMDEIVADGTENFRERIIKLVAKYVKNDSRGYLATYLESMIMHGGWHPYDAFYWHLMQLLMNEEEVEQWRRDTNERLAREHREEIEKEYKRLNNISE